MQELANMLLGSASGNTSASEDPFASGNGDPSSSENPNDEDRGTGNGDMSSLKICGPCLLSLTKKIVGPVKVVDKELNPSSLMFLATRLWRRQKGGPVVGKDIWKRHVLSGAIKGPPNGGNSTGGYTQNRVKIINGYQISLRIVKSLF
ncbi:hypothetical protein Tco_0213307 [Tanacetum coccineum]